MRGLLLLAVVAMVLLTPRAAAEPRPDSQTLKRKWRTSPSRTT